MAPAEEARRKEAEEKEEEEGEEGAQAFVRANKRKKRAITGSDTNRKSRLAGEEATGLI